VTGVPVITDTTPDVGVAVFADIAGVSDGDGFVTAGVSFQWLAQEANGTITPIPNATGASFIPTASEVGDRLRVVVSFVDLHLTAETSQASAATSAVSGGGGGGGGTGAVLSVPSTLDFGAKRLNTATVKRVDVTNTGTAPLTISGVTSSASAFTVSQGTCTAAVAPGRRCRIDVTFRPTARTVYNGTVTLTSDAVNSSATMAVSGTGR